MKTITLNLSLAEIIYDIQNKTYLTGRSTLNDSNHAHVANMQANDDEENAAQILRSITNAVAILRNRLSEFLAEGNNTSNNESLGESDQLSFPLRMPSNFNETVTRTLGQAAHQFIVATAISDWFAITAKGETADYSGAASDALQTLREALSKRNRPSRN